jgi:hypothetical protein
MHERMRIETTVFFLPEANMRQVDVHMLYERNFSTLSIKLKYEKANALKMHRWIRDLEFGV